MKFRALLLSVLAAATLLFAACSAPPVDQAATPSRVATAPPSVTPIPRPVATATAGALPGPSPDLSRRPLIFFGPLMPPDGSVDFMTLFNEEAPWQAAARRVQVFTLYGGWVAHFPWEPAEATDEQLKAIITDLNRRGMAIAFEAGPLVPTDACGAGIEGFFGPEEGLSIVSRLKRLGATVTHVALDEPFAFGHLYDGPNACQWPPEKIAQQVHDYILAIQSVYPDATIGDNEPLWAGVDIDELVEWLDAYKAVAGSNLPFIHLDPDYSRADWHVAAKQLEDAARARGVEFGMIYFGDAGDATDAEWLNKAFERARLYELVAGGRPDHVVFQSWMDRPDYVLPESSPDTFTALINRYFRTRTVLGLSLGPGAADGSRDVSGTLTEAGGAPLADVGASVDLSLKALDGPGLLAEYTLTGTVPAGALRSDVGFRVNTECGCRGISEFALYEVRYTEAPDTAARVPNGSFARGLAGWTAWGSSTPRLESSDSGTGSMLHVIAAADQDAAINSGSFRVTPGAAYTLTFVARVSPASLGSGYFDITFQNASGEFKREMIPLESATVPAGSALLDSDGRYTMTLDVMPRGTLWLEANYRGSERYWPAYASTEFSSR